MKILEDAEGRCPGREASGELGEGPEQTRAQLVGFGRRGLADRRGPLPQAGKEEGELVPASAAQDRQRRVVHLGQDRQPRVGEDCVRDPGFHRVGSALHHGPASAGGPGRELLEESTLPRSGFSMNEDNARPGAVRLEEALQSGEFVSPSDKGEWVGQSFGGLRMEHSILLVRSYVGASDVCGASIAA